MSIWRKLLREYSLWREYPPDRLRWMFSERRNALRTKTFFLGGTGYPYFLHAYNHTWANERAVEVPVVRAFLGSANPASVLEVGNVLSHYFDLGHTVLDKRERCLYRPVINADLLAFDPPRRFDPIVSISTLEHVGWDEVPRSEAAVEVGFQKLRALLSPGGRALVTVPVGYNRHLDGLLPALTRDGGTLQCLKRISGDNRWAEVDIVEALKCKYGEPFGGANSVVFVRMNADGSQPAAY
jgi:hypothetical protein